MLSDKIIHLKGLTSLYSVIPVIQVFSETYDSIFTFESIEMNKASFTVLSFFWKNTPFVQLPLVLPSYNLQGEVAGM